MPYLLEDLVIERIDLVDEGANSAAFIEIYKRKEQSNTMEIQEVISKMKPEHAEVVNAALAKAKEDSDAALLAKSTELEQVQASVTDLTAKLEEANTTIETLKAAQPAECACEGEAGEDGICKACGKPKKKGASFDEEETMKSLPEPVREYIAKMKLQKETAEEELRKAREKEVEAEAINKANSLKALPVEQSVLVGILKNCSPELLGVLTKVNKAIEDGVLAEVGKANPKGGSAKTAWDEINDKASELAKSAGLTQQKAFAQVMKENPDLYNKYLSEEGGSK